MHVIGIEGYSTRKIGLGLETLIVVDQIAPFQKIFVCAPLLSRFFSYELRTMGSDASLKSGGDSSSHLCLHRENLFHRSVISLCPEMTLSFSVDKLRCNSDVCSEPANAPLDDIADPELLSHKGQIHLRAELK